ncbi:RNA-binding domain CCCH-type zinc finger protein [Rhynchospora pubera]|uniref:RNA-binding domain CCCH-type zinc finger protein n=1 Tax=Rhynchospora pubera TaxID=906938 RepID=A0AAV8FKY3_9POAL|nr:RNA-binding domain CCCH-type zinc finger protein [Rhynchospora pubera]
MEVTECTKLVLDRIEKFEPEIATKIMGYLLLNRTYEEIIEYALGSDKKIISLILEAKSYLSSSPKGVIPPQFAPQCVPFPVTFVPHIPPQIGLTQFYGNSHLSIPPELIVQPNLKLFNPNLCTDSAQLCHYYQSKGNCKNGARCRFVHDLNFGPVGDWMRLEMEIREILLNRGRIPLTIASLPMVYLERYGKILQAEGYLTESQRHSKPGYSLTRLLGQMRTIALIERPHGQHSLVLAEDVHKYIDCTRLGQEDTSSSSHQIYLTFPAESKFTEDEVMMYFSKYGAVREVRIPRQARRMFGFVTFVYPETVQLVLSSSHPHYIGSSRILVKPYKEKSKVNERRAAEVDLSDFNAFNFIDLGSEPSMSLGEYSYVGRYLLDQMMNEREIDMALERRERSLVERQQMCKKLTGGPTHDLGSLQLAQDEFHRLKIDAGRETERAVSTSNSNSDLESGEIDLPESPFT